MENLPILTQHLILSQNPPRLQYFVARSSKASETSILNSSIIQTLLSELSKNPKLQNTLESAAPSLQNLSQSPNLMKSYQFARNFAYNFNSPSGYLGKYGVSFCQRPALEKPEIKSQKERLKTTVTDKTEKPSTKEESFGKKRKNRRLATEINRMFKCPSEYCQKAYGCESALRLHIKAKHKATIGHKRDQKIEILLSKTFKKNTE